MAKNQISSEEKKAHRKAIWAGAREGMREGFSESFMTMAKASIATSSVIITVMALHVLTGRQLIPGWLPKN